MGILENLRLYFGVIAGGIRFWAGSPRKFKLRVDHDYEVRRERERQEVAAAIGVTLGDNDSQLIQSLAEERRGSSSERCTNMWTQILEELEHPAIKYIHLECWDSQYKRWRPCGVAINLEKKLPEYHIQGTGDLLGGGHTGSGMIGVFLFSLPITLPLSPILIALNQYYSYRERRLGMSRHGQALLKSLRGQLDSETEALLVEALKNDWRR